jgi:hypothetical protein
MDKPRRPNSPDRSSEVPSAWSDDALLALVRASDEAEQLHEDAQRPVPSLRLAGTPARSGGKPGLAWSWRWFAAAAALVAVGVIVFSPRPASLSRPIAAGTHEQTSPMSGSSNPSLPESSHVATSRSAAVAMPVRQASRPGDATVILTISQDADGRCRCVTSVTHQLAAGQSVGDLPSTELLGVGLQRLCETNPDRVLVLGISGPRELLPQSKAEAERFASCLDRGPGECDEDPTCFASSALACVSPSVNIVAETLAMRR